MKLFTPGLLIILRDTFQLAQQVSVAESMTTRIPEIWCPEIMHHRTFASWKDLFHWLPDFPVFDDDRTT
jgi:hypothetical protein